MVKITKRSVDGLTSLGDQPTFLWDDVLAGFGVKALPSGAKRYLVKYRANGGGRAAPQRWLMLGSHGQLTPDQARALAQQALAAVARGEDPQAEKFKRRSAPTLREVWVRFANEHLTSKKASTRKEYESQWDGIIDPKLGNLSVETLSTSEIDRLHKSMRASPYRANRVLALISRLCSLAERWGWRPFGTNPCKHVERFPEQPRTRFLNVAEIEQIGEAMANLVAEKAITESARNAIELLLLTGGRLNEVLEAQWSWVNLQRQVISLPDSKSGAKSLYLSEQAISVLVRQRELSSHSRYVFASRWNPDRVLNLRRSWACICEHAGCRGVRLHDLRHTAASIAVGRGASLPIIGKLLGHSQAQTTLRYSHVDVDPALAAANEIGNVVQRAFAKSRR